ncbi:MAG: right-handed parallel beta-helix repeat-containing protein, partial [Planctomycetota bacterium]
MLFKKAKNMLSVCPKTGKCLGLQRKYHWLIWVFPIAGLLSLIWFLIRVVPKPSRATYPCQRVAAPLASGFVIWLTGLIGSTIAYRKARRHLHQSRYVVAGICVVVSVAAIWWSLAVTSDNPATAAFIPTDPPNTPMGVGKGIHPGRVAWVRDPGAAKWDGTTGSWWDDDNTDQGAVDYIMSKSIQTLTGESTDPNAWDALFRHFNQTKGFGDVGYQAGEKVAIKINKNEDNRATWSPSRGVPSPHLIYSVLDQLINVVGVPGSAITIYDASRYIGDPIYNKVKSNPDPDFQDVTFVVKPNRAGNGRLAAVHDAGNPIYTKAGTAYLPQCVTQAKYLINMALLRPHTMFGITLCAKNHFGSVRFPSVSNNDGWTPSPLHNHGGRTKPMDTYNCLVNLNGHRHLSGKTLLYMIDALYPSRNQNSSQGYVIKYVSFGDKWLSSLLISQDPVAIDSVGLDFMRSEPRCVDVTGYPENYLHEMALADNPPSGTFYDPEGDGVRLESMGVHEHWNNPVDRQYSRNLGTGGGIELVKPPLTNPDGTVENVTAGKRYDYIRHAISDADSNDEIVVSPGIYSESINLGGKNLTLRSTDPADQAVVAATIINGGDRVVTFSGGEDASCVLAGFTVTGASTGIYCFGASPTINTCSIAGNGGAGIELHNGSNPTIINCRIAANAGAGIQMWALTGGRVIIYNYPTITNCTITGNLEQGILGGIPTITNSIIWANLPEQIAEAEDTISVTYSDVQGGFVGEGNIDADPLFADPTNGDYHLKSQAGRWDPNSQTWVQDQVTSPCIDAGDVSTPIGFEPSPNGGVINMG